MTIQRENAIVQISTGQVLAGGIAGLVEVTTMQPVDIMKTRFQIQRGSDNLTRYTSLADCFKKIIRNEGPLSLYKGILPPMLADTPKRAAKFTSFEYFRYVLSQMNFTGPWSLVAAGFGSGLTEGVITTPFERVKVYMQAQRMQMSQMPSTWSVARNIVKRDGFGTRGLLKGLTATVARDGMFGATYFGLYYNMKWFSMPSHKQNSIPLRLMLGFLAGSLSSLANSPLDVAKSRIQGPQTTNKYHSAIATIHTVFKEEGFLAVYQGTVPKMLRTGLGGSILLVVYEEALTYMKTD